MSASPSQLTQPSKRPLEEPSSPSRTGDQPEAKRPALDKVVRKDGEVELAHMPEKAKKEEDDDAEAEAEAEPVKEETETEAPTADAAADDGDTDKVSIKSEAPDGAAAEAAAEEEDKTAPKLAAEAGPSADPASAPSANDESSWIHIRAVITSPEAATVIGKAGENVSNIRKLSGAKCTISDYNKGAIERILTVSGIVDAVAKAFGLIIRTLHNEPLDEPSNAQSKTYPLRLLLPHVLIGSVIGKGGARIREIQEVSCAKLNASASCLPMSTERSLVVMGVADAVHIATYYVVSTLLQQLVERYSGPAASAYATRSGGPVGVVPGGLQVIPYCPQPGAGSYGKRDYYSQQPERRSAQPGPGGPYGDHYGHASPHGGPQMPGPYGAQGGGAAPYGGGPAQHMAPYGAAAGPGGGAPMHGGAAAAGGPAPHGPAGGAASVTQQIFIPNDMVGAIIGKGGQKINEIRQTSGSVIKINEPQDNSNERLVTITGSQECNRIALYMLYARLEQEKHRA